ncbi:MAG: DUF4395 domain-containing protein [Aeromicrobium sp.]|uniref:DUF4395 domain-containing protein n=1 Tax=Aeromicrobium sp. TaxID=1871063 RepID=UPI003C324E95
MSTLTATSTARQVDPRGLRVSAGITAAVLAMILILPATIGLPLLAAQVVVFALAALVGLPYSPYSQFFARVVRPRIGAPLETEDARPPRFAQVVGLAFTASGLLALLAGATAAGLVLVAFALVAALLNATTGFCLGCEMYLMFKRFAPLRTA